MDRTSVTKATAQIGFIKFVLIPLFQSFCTLFPKVEEVMVEPLKAALEHYEKLKTMEDEKEKKEQQPQT